MTHVLRKNHQPPEAISPRRTLASRSGLVMAITLVAVLLVMLLGAALAEGFLAHRRYLRTSEYQLHASWLGESGLQRARQRWSSEPDYVGERWEPTDKSNPLGSVQVHVEPVEGRAETYRIIVEASYPAYADQAVIERRELLVQRAAPQTSAEPSKENES